MPPNVLITHVRLSLPPMSALPIEKGKDDEDVLATSLREDSSNQDSTKTLADGPASPCPSVDEEECIIKRSEEVMDTTDNIKEELPRAFKQPSNPLSSKVITLLTSSTASRTVVGASTIPETPSTVPGLAMKTASPKLLGASSPPCSPPPSRSRGPASPSQRVACSPLQNSLGLGSNSRLAGTGGGKRPAGDGGSSRSPGSSPYTPLHQSRRPREPPCSIIVAPGSSQGKRSKTTSKKTVFSVMMAAASSKGRKGAACRERGTTPGNRHKGSNQAPCDKLGKRNPRGGAQAGRTTSKKRRKKAVRAVDPWGGASSVPSTTAENTSREDQAEKEEEEKEEKGGKPSRKKEVQQPSKQELGIDQYYLDAGQKVLGTIVCEECGLLYYPGQPEDEKNHRRVHRRRLRAVPFPGWRQENLVQLRKEDPPGTSRRRNSHDPSGPKAKVSSFFSAVSGERGGAGAVRGTREEEMGSGGSDEARIVEVLPADHVMHREKVAEVLTAMVEALGSTEDCIASPHQDGGRTFFYIAGKSVQGVAVVRPLNSAWCVLDCPEYAPPTDEGGSGSDSGSSEPPCPSSAPLLGMRGHSTADRPIYKAQLGVDKIWVHSSARRSGVASTLMDSIRGHLFYGFTVPRDMCAFSEPTGAGQRFAARYVGTEAFLTYSGDGSSVMSTVGSAMAAVAGTKAAASGQKLCVPRSC